MRQVRTVKSYDSNNILSHIIIIVNSKKAVFSWVATGNRTQISGTTTRCVNRYTIATILRSYPKEASMSKSISFSR